MILFTKTLNEDSIDVKRGLERNAYGNVSAMKIVPFGAFLGWHLQEINISEFLYFCTSKIVFRILFIESLYINILTRQ